MCLLYQIANRIGNMDERANEGMKHRVWRRIAVKSVVLAVWAIGMRALALQGDQELPQRAYFCMLFAILVVWAVSTVRDARRLRHAQKAAVDKVQDCFDADMSSFFGDEPDSPAQGLPAPGITFTVEQLEAMLAQARNQRKGEVA